MFAVCVYRIFFCKQKTAYEMRISDWSSDVCSSDLDDADDDHQRADDQPQRPEPRVPTLLLAMLVIAAETLARRRALQPIPACADLRDHSGEARLAMSITKRYFTSLFSKIGRASCRERVCEYV